MLFPFERHPTGKRRRRVTASLPLACAEEPLICSDAAFPRSQLEGRRALAGEIPVSATSAQHATIVFTKHPFSATVWRQGDWFVSQCLEVDVASQGQTEDEALDNLREALELHFEPPAATHPPVVRHLEVEVGAA
jgi:predicted RNase H-like HicB family nuclease